MWIPSSLLGALDRADPRASDRTRAQIINLPSGDAGTIETLKIMRELVKAAIVNPDQIIRTKVREILSGVPPRQYVEEIKAIHAYVRDQIRYTKDPVGIELVQTPEKTLEFASGDCDDKATLLAALLSAAGHPSKFVAISLDGGPFSHVLVETKAGTRWIPLETIINKEPGWYPPGVKRAYRLKV